MITVTLPNAEAGACRQTKGSRDVMSSLDRLTVLGSGVLGGQIAWHSAFMGKTVTVYDNAPDAIERCRIMHEQYAAIYLSDVGASEGDVSATRQRLDLHHRPGRSGGRGRCRDRGGARDPGRQDRRLQGDGRAAAAGHPRSHELLDAPAQRLRGGHRPAREVLRSPLRHDDLGDELRRDSWPTRARRGRRSPR